MNCLAQLLLALSYPTKKIFGVNLIESEGSRVQSSDFSNNVI